MGYLQDTLPLDEGALPETFSIPNTHRGEQRSGGAQNNDLGDQLHYTLGGTKIAQQNRSDHGCRKRARNHSDAENAGFFASLAAQVSLAAGDFLG